MEKMRMESPDIAAQNIDKVAELFQAASRRPWMRSTARLTIRSIRRS